MTGFKGGCLCGAVTFKSTVDPKFSGHCHCVHCRKSGGSGHVTFLTVPKEAFTISGKVTFYDSIADAGSTVSRGFCPVCGSSICMKISTSPDTVFPYASVLDDPNIAEPKEILYASRAPAWDHMDPSLPAFAKNPN